MRYIWFFLGLGTTIHLLFFLFSSEQFPESQVARYFAFIAAVASIPLIITWRRDIRENPTGFVALILTACFALDFVVHNETLTNWLVDMFRSPETSMRHYSFSMSLTLLALYLATQIFTSTRSVLAKALRRSTPEPLA
jgi:heme A synthase